MKIRTQIIGLVIVTMGLMVVGGSYCYVNLNQIRNQITWLVENDQRINRELLNITTKHFEHRTLFEQTLEYGQLMAEGKIEPEIFQKSLSRYQEVCGSLHGSIEFNDEFLENISTSDLPVDVKNRFSYMKGDLERIRDEHSVCMPHSGNIFGLIKEGKAAQAEVLAREKLESEAHLDNMLIAFLKKLDSSNAAILNRTKQQETDALYYLTVFYLVSIALGLGLSIFISRKISKSLNNAVNIALRIAKGDRKVNIQTRTGDETGTLLTTMKTMLSSLNEAEGSLIRINEELEHRVEERTEELMNVNSNLTVEVEERKKAEIRLLELHKELNTFMYKTSHDLKGPIVSIQGVLNLAEPDFDGDPEASQYLNMIRTCADRLDEILKRLHEVTTLKERGAQHELANLHDMTAAARDRLQALAVDRGVELETVVKGTELIKTDPAIVESMLFHLMQNSIHYRDRRKENSYCRVLIDTSTADQLVLEVSDNGTGIAEGFKSQVFNMFFKGTARTEGSGLGLYIVKWAVQVMEGTIELRSTENEGTVVRITVPIPTQVEEQREVEISADQPLEV